MVNIKVVNNEITKTNKINFDLRKIEKKIATMSYKGTGLVKDIKVEKARLPSIAEIFYESIFLKRIPSPTNLYKNYISEYFNLKNNKECEYNNNTYNLEGVKARVLRTYPSLLRDFHFYILCYESGLFDRVEYSLLTDICDGIDLFVTYKGVRFGVSLFVDTKRSNYFKKKKYKRHNYSNLKEICMTINPFDKKNYVGEYALYRDSHIRNMVLKMDDELSEQAIV